MARFGGNGRLCRDDAERGGHYAGQNRKEEAVWLLFEVMSFATEAGERIRRRFRLLISPGVRRFRQISPLFVHSSHLETAGPFALVSGAQSWKIRIG
jgi:hypothetical protein